MVRKFGFGLKRRRIPIATIGSRPVLVITPGHEELPLRVHGIGSHIRMDSMKRELRTLVEWSMWRVLAGQMLGWPACTKKEVCPRKEASWPRIVSELVGKGKGGMAVRLGSHRLLIIKSTSRNRVLESRIFLLAAISVLSMLLGMLVWELFLWNVNEIFKEFLSFIHLLSVHLMISILKIFMWRLCK